MTDAIGWMPGIVVAGHQVASGRCGDARFPEGTILPQLAYFESCVPRFQAYLGGSPFPGTINVRLLGGTIDFGEPDHRVGPFRWTTHYAPESFLISACLLEHAAGRYPAYLYVPDPATKPEHHQPADVIELLAPRVPALEYGDRVAIGCRPELIRARA